MNLNPLKETSAGCFLSGTFRLPLRMIVPRREKAAGMAGEVVYVSSWSKDS